MVQLSVSCKTICTLFCCPENFLSRWAHEWHYVNHTSTVTLTSCKTPKRRKYWHELPDLRFKISNQMQPYKIIEFSILLNSLDAILKHQQQNELGQHASFEEMNLLNIEQDNPSLHHLFFLFRAFLPNRKIRNHQAL